MKYRNGKIAAFLILTISVIIIDVGMSTVEAVWPFDQFMSPSTNETANQTSQDSFKNELPGEHGESTDENN